MTQDTAQKAETTMTPAQMIAVGLSHHQSGRFGEAKEMYMQVLTAEPENFDALHLLGVLAHQVGKNELAVDLIERAVRQTENAVAFNNLGEAYKGLKRLDEAERCYRKALELNPGFAEVCSNLGNALKELGRGEEAVQVYRQALAINPKFTLVHYNLANVLQDLGELDEAETCLVQALALNPDNVDAAAGLSKLRLLRGDYEQGLSYFQNRLVTGAESPAGRSREALKQLQGLARWQGEPLEGKRLLLITEHGAGDNLMMMRYLPLLKKLKPQRLLAYATPHLTRVLLNLGSLDQVISMTEPLPVGEFDLYCPMMSLPYLFKTGLGNIPVKMPYLRLPREMKKQWRTRVKEIAGVKVGLVWAAGKLSNSYARRSMALEQFRPLADVPEVQLVNLQKGKEADQLQAVDWKVFDCMSECKDFLDTAALVDQLDLVISVDTSVAHLAGALGKPVWLLNSFESEWRWMRDREDSPWYPSMRIFRQKQHGDWAGVIEEVAEQLAIFVQTA
jgi:tetratricopeptide (TPR) repeat protein